MSVYHCGSCAAPISPTNARFHCQECPNFDLCTNCSAIGRVGGVHAVTHRTVLIPQSGYAVQSSGQQPSYSQLPVGSPLPTAHTQSPQPTYPPPPPAYPPPPTAYPTPSPQPHGYQQPGAQGQYAGAQPAQAQAAFSGWPALFTSDGAPTTCFTTLMQELFSRLDPSRTGRLTPEAYSQFLDAQGQPLAANSCESPSRCLSVDLDVFHAGKQAFMQASGSDEDRRNRADQVLKATLDMFAVQYVIAERATARPPASNHSSNPFSLRGLTQMVTESMRLPSAMPLLTLNGFIDANVKYILADPSSGWTHLNNALRAFQLPMWQQHGDVPRQLLPAVADSRIGAMAEQSAQDQIAALEMRTRINARANQIMVENAIPGVYYKHEYRKY